jgi:hypothetical protein
MVQKSLATRLSAMAESSIRVDSGSCLQMTSLAATCKHLPVVTLGPFRSVGFVRSGLANCARFGWARVLRTKNCEGVSCTERPVSRTLHISGVRVPGVTSVRRKLCEIVAVHYRPSIAYAGGALPNDICYLKSLARPNPKIGSVRISARQE